MPVGHESGMCDCYCHTIVLLPDFTPLWNGTSHGIRAASLLHAA
jgi:hypothetical protein